MASRMAPSTPRSGAPRLSRRCSVTRTSRSTGAISMGSSGARPEASSSASIPVFPVTTMRSADTPSARRLASAPRVGAKWMLARAPARRRLASSGNGLSMLSVRSPASTWAKGIRR